MEFLGMSIEKTTDYREVFDVEYDDDGQLYLVSKKTYHHDDPDEGLVFDYKYGVSACADIYGGQVGIVLYLIPNPEFWCEEALDEVIRMNGWKTMPRREVVANIMISDAISNNLCALFGEERVYFDNENYNDELYHVADNEDVKAMLDAAGTCIGIFDSMRGYKFDAAVNGIGITNTDRLHEVINGRSALKTALARHNI